MVAFREALRALLVAGRGGDAKAVERLNRAARGARLDARLSPEGAPILDARVSGLDDVFGRWMSIVVHGHLDDEWKRFKVCANPECRLAFYDDTRTYARRWCSKRCGDLIRARAYRGSARYRRLMGRS